MKNYTELIINLAKSQDLDVIIELAKEAKKYKNNNIDFSLNWKQVGKKFIMVDDEVDEYGREIVYTITDINNKYVDIEYDKRDCGFDDSYDLEYAETNFENGSWLLLK